VRQAPAAKSTDKSGNIKYYIVNKYQDLPTTPSSLRLFYANLRGIHTQGKFDEIKCILKATTSLIHILILVETWFSSDTDAQFYNLPNYNHTYVQLKTEQRRRRSLHLHS
jgi:hypothetical protein